MSQTHNAAALKCESLSRPNILTLANSALKKRPRRKKGDVNEATSFSSLLIVPRIGC